MPQRKSNTPINLQNSKVKIPTPQHPTSADESNPTAHPLNNEIIPTWKIAYHADELSTPNTRQIGSEPSAIDDLIECNDEADTPTSPRSPSSSDNSPEAYKIDILGPVDEFDDESIDQAEPPDSLSETRNIDDLPIFPIECLPGIAGEMATEIARVTTSGNEALAAASILGILSASMGAGIEAPSGSGKSVKGNLYILAIADSGTGKGEAFNLAGKPFFDLAAKDLEEFERSVKPGLEADMAIAKKRAEKLCAQAADAKDPDKRKSLTLEHAAAVKEQTAIRIALAAEPRWHVADATKEALAAVLAGQPGEATASLSSESRGLFGILHGRYNKEGGDEDIYTAAYSGDPITIDRKSSGKITLRRPCLSILWMVQPDAANSSLARDQMTVSGLMPRFLFFNPLAQAKERLECPAPIATQILEGWANLITKVSKAYRNRRDAALLVVVTAEAVAIIDAYTNEIVRRRNVGDLSDLKLYAARWAENAWRLALVLHVAQHSDSSHDHPLDEKTMERTLQIMRWFNERQLEILQTGRRNKLKKRLLGLLGLLEEHQGRMTLRDLGKSHHYSKDEITLLNNAYPELFYVKSVTGIGRPSPCVIIGKPTASS